MKWKILNKNKSQIDEMIKIILNNRGIRTKKEIENFLNPKLENVTVESVGIDKNQIKKSINRIKKAVKSQEQIIVFGDYDVDGICGSAILWETLVSLGAKSLPYIPHRLDEGYGLSKAGIDSLLLKNPKIKLIITVDNGIVANRSVDYAAKKGIDVIITDHHVPSKKLPKALSMVPTTNLCGAE